MSQMSITQVAYLVIARALIGIDSALENIIMCGFSKKIPLIKNLFELTDRLLNLGEVLLVLPKRAPNKEQLFEIISFLKTNNLTKEFLSIWPEGNWRVLAWILVLENIRRNSKPRYFHFDLHALFLSAVVKFDNVHAKTPFDYPMLKELFPSIGKEDLRKIKQRLSEVNIKLAEAKKERQLELLLSIESHTGNASLPLNASKENPTEAGRTTALVMENLDVRTQRASPPPNVDESADTLGAGAPTRVRQKLHREIREIRYCSTPAIDLAGLVGSIIVFSVVLFLIERETYVLKIAWWHCSIGGFISTLVFLIVWPVFKAIMLRSRLKVFFMGQPIVS